MVQAVQTSSRSPSRFQLYNDKLGYLTKQRDFYRTYAAAAVAFSFFGIGPLTLMLCKRFAKFPLSYSLGFSAVSISVAFTSIAWKPIEWWSFYNQKIMQLEDWYNADTPNSTSKLD